MNPLILADPRPLRAASALAPQDLGPDLFEDLGRADRVFARLRVDDPVHWTADSGGYWAVTRPAEIVEVSKRPGDFSSALDRGGITIAGESDPGILRDSASMITSDPPEHLAWRRLFAPVFAEAGVAQLEPLIRAIVDEILDELDRHDEADWAEVVGAELPARVMGELLGVASPEHRRMCRWATAIDGQDDPEVAGAGPGLSACIAEMTACGLRAWERTAFDGAGELVARLHAARRDGAPVSEERFLAMFAMFVIAGAETVRNCLIGGLEALHQHPEQLARLRARPDLLPQAVDEINRWITPIMHFRRTAVRDTEIAGRRIRAGERVVLWYYSANRDERRFAEPARFDVGREGPRHLAFGAGQHLCVGWRLAELELRVLFEICLARFPHLRPSAPASRLRSNFINGYKHLWVRPHG